jgi:hypothetical protein
VHDHERFLSELLCVVRELLCVVRELLQSAFYTFGTFTFGTFTVTSPAWFIKCALEAAKFGTHCIEPRLDCLRHIEWAVFLMLSVFQFF